jgi:hypothetical protein
VLVCKKTDSIWSNPHFFIDGRFVDYRAITREAFLPQRDLLVIIQVMTLFFRRQLKVSILIAVLFCLLIVAVSPAAVTVQMMRAKGVELQVAFQYLLANFSGTVASQWALVDFEQTKGEIYTLNPGFNEIHIFNAQGMALLSFGDQNDVVSAADLSGSDSGNIYLLARNFATYGIQVLNFRGIAIGNIFPANIPKQFGYFSPDRLESQNGLLYLLDSASMKIVSMDINGMVMKSIDLSKQLQSFDKSEGKPENRGIVTDISGFSVGPDGSIYFTVANLFKAFRLNLDGTLDAFGISGSGPGKFGVVSGIAAADNGAIYVADKLRSVILIFDRSFRFQGEFGYRGGSPQNLIAPNDLAVDLAGSRVLVSQAANKGIGVYKVNLKTP